MSKPDPVVEYIPCDGCEEGVPVHESRLKGVSLGGKIEVECSCGSTPSVIVEGEVWKDILKERDSRETGK